MGEVPRCQAKNRAKEQCKRPARKGARVCSMHGAGTRKRVENGTRQNPATAPITHGMTAQPETLEQWERFEQSFRERIDFYLSNQAQLRNLDGLLARLWAVADILSEKRPEATWSPEGGEHPPPIFPVLTGIATALERVARIEWKIRQSSAPTLTIVQAKRLVRGVVELMHEFVAPDVLDECIRRLTRLGEQLVGGSDPGGERARA